MAQEREERLAVGKEPRATAAKSAGRRARAVSMEFLPPLVALALVGATWEAWVRLSGTEPYVLPSPTAVLRRFLEDSRLLGREGLTTASEAIAGFVIGSGVALVAAAAMAHSRVLERALFPIAVLVKVTPIIAIAPLLVIWFGFGIAPKLFIGSLIVFFPVLVNGVTGFRSVDPASLEFFRSVHASSWETFWKLRWPSSLPYLFAAFKVSITLSVIGAVVAEWFSGEDGLGRVVQIANYNLDLPLAFAAVLMLALIGIGLYLATALIERRVLRWHASVRG